MSGVKFTDKRVIGAVFMAAAVVWFMAAWLQGQLVYSIIGVMFLVSGLAWIARARQVSK
jgi:hypothetical protein